MKYSFSALLALLLTIPVPAQSGPGAKLTLNTVVIDPGHGGKDVGCVSRDKKTYEKNITLDISRRLAGKISSAYPEVNVKMTRSDDRFVELENRAVFANKAGANLFISIHVNSVEKGTTANGYSVHCLGKSRNKDNDLYSKNLDLVKRENSVILLEDNYQATYQGFDPNDPQSSIIFNLMQNAHLSASLAFADDVARAMGNKPIKTNRGISQDPFWVLWRTAMPSVLIEVGFITNPDDLATMRSPEGRDAIATNIFNAFCAFKSRYDGTPEKAIDDKTEPEKVKEEARNDNPDSVTQEPKDVTAGVESENTDGIMYGVQILAIGKKMALDDPYFRGNNVMEIKSGKLYKYIAGCSPSVEKVKKSLPAFKKNFKDAYVVKIEDGNTIAVR